MSKFLQFTPCEKCGSSDANAEYDDSYYCFSCNKYTPKLSLKRFKAIKEVRVCKGITLENKLAVGALKWLLGYGLTSDEIAQFTYARERIGKYGLMPCELLVLYSSNDYWCARNFGKGAKYLTSGTKPFLKYGFNQDVLVFVEDIVSAVKVGRQFTAVPMLGSMPSQDAASHLDAYKNVFIWQDRDLFKKSITTARNLSERLNKRVRIIYSENDPKCYDDAAIRKYLTL
jgi:hypothetical protein